MAGTGKAWHFPLAVRGTHPDSQARLCPNGAHFLCTSERRPAHRLHISLSPNNAKTTKKPLLSDPYNLAHPLLDMSLSSTLPSMELP
tara:strand:+ start:6932 stop:7192 length:261 start_codon:yes stop_codon:yes gene_type:complete